MKTNQKGFSVVEILAVVSIAILLGVGGLLVYNRQKDQETINNTATKNGQETTTQIKSTDGTFDAAIYDIDIKLQTASDIDKLPEYTPDSFKEFILGVLQENEYYPHFLDNVDTITQYQIHKISQVNIVGGQTPVDKNGDGHAGGAPIIWVLTPAGSWDQETLNGPECKSKNGGLIYEEFAKECFVEPDTDSWTKNPNGSIKSLAR